MMKRGSLIISPVFQSESRSRHRTSCSKSSSGGPVQKSPHPFRYWDVPVGLLLDSCSTGTSHSFGLHELQAAAESRRHHFPRLVGRIKPSIHELHHHLERESGDSSQVLEGYLHGPHPVVDELGNGIAPVLVGVLFHFRKLRRSASTSFRLTLKTLGTCVPPFRPPLERNAAWPPEKPLPEGVAIRGTLEPFPLRALPRVMGLFPW